MRYTPRSELDNRVARLQAVLTSEDIDCILIRQNVHLYYFAGTIQNSHLFIPASGDPVLMTRRDYGRARLESQLEHVVPLRSFRDLSPLLRDNGIQGMGKLGLELDNLPADLYLAYGRLFPGSKLVDASHLLRQVRRIKSAWEIARMEEAAEQVDLMFQAARNNLRVGIREIDLAAEVEKVGRVNGHPGLIRMHAWNSENTYGYISAGANSAVPVHADTAGGGAGVTPALGQGASYRQINPGEPVYMDVTGCVDGYSIDQTRMLIAGDVPENIAAAFDAMHTIYRQLKPMLRPGVACCDIFEEAAKLGQGSGFGDYFIAGKKGLGFVGHGLGLELDEPPALAKRVTTLLEPGMVIALEPKVTIPGIGTIGVENSHLITPDGARVLNISPEELCRV